MKFSEVNKKASTNLHWQHDSGSGLQLYGNIPQDAKNHTEYVLNPRNCTLFTLITPDKPNSGGMTGIIGYERWVQFSPKGWDEMQTANAQVMTHAVKVLPQIIDGLKDFLNDSISYPQLSLHPNSEDRLKRLLKLAEEMEVKQSK